MTTIIPAPNARPIIATEASIIINVCSHTWFIIPVMIAYRVSSIITVTPRDPI